MDCPDIARQIDRARQSINFDAERDHYITTCTKVLMRAQRYGDIMFPCSSTLICCQERIWGIQEHSQISTCGTLLGCGIDKGQKHIPACPSMLHFFIQSLSHYIRFRIQAPSTLKPTVKKFLERFYNRRGNGSKNFRRGYRET